MGAKPIFPVPTELSNSFVLSSFEGCELTANSEGRVTTWKIYSIGKTDFKIILPNESSQDFAEGLILEDCQLNLPFVEVSLKIETSYVVSTNTHEGQRLVTLNSSTDGFSSKLWWILNRISLWDGQEAQAIPSHKTLPKIPGRGHYSEEARMDRVAFIREQTQKPLVRLDSIDIRAERLTSNIENLIGSVEIPVGLAGPLVFHGQYAQGPVYVPLATTEGALVASMTRGALAISRSGGVFPRILKQQMIRVPYFRFKSLKGALLFCRWLLDNFAEIKQETATVSKRAELISLEPVLLGRHVNVRFLYQTGDAAGQNMTTNCTWHACQWILHQSQLVPDMGIEHFLIEGNLSGDKKVNFLSFISGRGISVTAEAFISEQDLEQVLKTNSSEISQAYMQCANGAFKSGSVGMNGNIANTIAAIFTATGQDIASVHESSIGLVSVQPIDGGIHMSLSLPALVIGTVGGGTGLPDQNQFLDLMDCAGTNKARRLAEVIAGYCLALDLSTLAAIASGQFASAHEKYGRNRPVLHFRKEDFTPEFFQQALNQNREQGYVLDKVQRKKSMDSGSSIISDLTAQHTDKVVGLFNFELLVRDQKNQQKNLDIVVKVKALDSDVLMMTKSLAALCHPQITANVRRFGSRIGFESCHLRETALFREEDRRLRDHMPISYGVLEDTSREMHIIIMESLEHYPLLNSVDKPQLWQKSELESVVRGLGAIHSVYWKKDQELRKKPWMGSPFKAESMVEMVEFWQYLGVHASHEFPEWYTLQDLQMHTQRVEDLPNWWKEIDQLPKTLIHNDCNPRNACLRTTDEGQRLCLYDWELATIHLPQHDLAEFLCFVELDHSDPKVLEHWVEQHRIVLSRTAEDDIDSREWRKGFALSLLDLSVNRVPFYIMAHTARHYSFMERIYFNLQKMLKATHPWLSDKD